MSETHGGNIYRLAERLGISEGAVLDFSASINPLGVPESAKEAIVKNLTALFNYPDPDCLNLRMKIAGRCGVDPDSVICGNGSTELIFLTARALKPEKALIPSPTFSEYEKACQMTGSGLQIARYELRDEENFDIDPDRFIAAMEKQCSSVLPSTFSLQPSVVAFLCNPNNPTGRLIDRKNMIKIAEAAKALKCVLVVDEAFIDFCPGASIIDQVENNPYLIVLRSMTKFYALSGLRLGYAVMPLSLLRSVKEVKEPWTVNTMAQIAGVAALGDTTYENETFRMIVPERKRLEEGFGRLGISYLRSAANYYLLQVGNSGDVTAYLREKNILVRDCANFPGLDDSYVRVAVKSERHNISLLKELSSCPAL